MSKRIYVAGFLFNLVGSMMALVEKKKFPPGQDWSKNPNNAIGGKVEWEKLNETRARAMVREFEEETGVKTEEKDWDPFVQLYTSSWEVTFYRCFSSEYLSKVRTIEEEEIVTVATKSLDRVVANLRWLVPMALDRNIKFAEIQERE